MRDDGLGQVLLEYTQDKVVIVDEAGEFVYLNTAAERILGFSPDELVGECAFDYIHPESRSTARSTFHRVLQADEEQTETLRYRHRTSDGDWVWLESRFSNLTDPALGGYVVVSRDVTEVVEAEHGHRETRTRLEELTRSVGDVLWMFTGDWSELLFVNPAFEDVFGIPVDELEGDPQQFLDAVHPDDVPAVERAMARLSEGESIDVEYRVNADRDYDVFVWVQGEPIVEDGEVVRVVGFVRDISERRRRERQLAVMDNLLRHNIRNDMTVILGEADYIATHEDDDLSDHAEIIRQQGESLLRSADKQRDILELLTSPPNPRPVELAPLVSSAVETVEGRHPTATIDWTVPGDTEAVALAELRVAIVELLENAIRHNPDPDGLVEVTVDRGGESVALAVRDDGPPIPEQEYACLTDDRVMDDVYHSTGLGLWLVYWVVDLSRGSVEFTRSESGGNVVTVRLEGRRSG